MIRPAAAARPARAIAAAAVAIAVAVAACQATAPSVEPLDPRVAVGKERTCAELGLSDVRCTLLRLRAAKTFEEARPDAVVTAQELHEPGSPPDGQSPIPSSQTVALVVVFVLEDGSRASVPVLCPRNPSGADQACDPRIQ